MPLEPIASRLADERSTRIFAFFRRHHKTAPAAARAFCVGQLGTPISLFDFRRAEIERRQIDLRDIDLHFVRIDRR